MVHNKKAFPPSLTLVHLICCSQKIDMSQTRMFVDFRMLNSHLNTSELLQISMSFYLLLVKELLKKLLDQTIPALLVKSNDTVSHCTVSSCSHYCSFSFNIK